MWCEGVDVRFNDVPRFGVFSDGVVGRWDCGTVGWLYGCVGGFTGLRGDRWACRRVYVGSPQKGGLDVGAPFCA